MFDRWAYLGTIHDMAELPELLAQPRPGFDPAMVKLIRSLLKKRGHAVVAL